MSVVPGARRRSQRGHSVFIPNILPPQLDLSVETERLIEDATHLLGQVEMCRTLLPNADLLIYSSLQREALASSTIEGTIASADELVRYQALQHSEREAVREVANYGYALEWGVEQLVSRPPGTVLILGLHERLLHRVRGESQAGRFKEQQNYIGTHPEKAIEDAIFVPPAPENIDALVRDLERYINLENHEARVVQCALVHYQFETIHPFHDGNGRVGRLLIILQMIQLNLLSAPLIYPSASSLKYGANRRLHTYYSSPYRAEAPRACLSAPLMRNGALASISSAIVRNTISACKRCGIAAIGMAGSSSLRAESKNNVLKQSTLHT